MIRRLLPKPLRKALARLYYPIYRAGVRVWCAYASVDDRLVQSEQGYFALPPADQIRAGIAKLAEVCHRETGVPERGANRLRRA